MSFDPDSTLCRYCSQYYSNCWASHECPGCGAPKKDAPEYVQVELINGNRKLVTWIASNLAIKGKEVTIWRGGSFASVEDGSCWEDGWTVNTVYCATKTLSELDTMARNIHDYRSRINNKRTKYGRRRSVDSTWD